MKDKTILLWWFYDAPVEYRELTPHGGDEDFLAFVPDGVSTPLWMEDVYGAGSFATCDVSIHEVDGGTVYISAHA